MVPFRSLDAATSTGAGIAVDLGEVLTTHSMIAVATGSPSNRHVELQGSHDGFVWAVLATADPGDAGLATTVINTPLRYVRANLATLAGGTSPTVTVTIASA
jgi:hypothetical protein